MTTYLDWLSDLFYDWLCQERALNGRPCLLWPAGD